MSPLPWRSASGPNDRPHRPIARITLLGSASRSPMMRCSCGQLIAPDCPVPRWSTTTRSRLSVRSRSRNVRKFRWSANVLDEPGPPSLANKASFTVDDGSLCGSTMKARSRVRPYGRLRSIGTGIVPQSHSGSSSHAAKATFGVTDNIDAAAGRLLPASGSLAASRCHGLPLYSWPVIGVPGSSGSALTGIVTSVTATTVALAAASPVLNLMAAPPVSRAGHGQRDNGLGAVSSLTRHRRRRAGTFTPSADRIPTATSGERGEPGVVQVGEPTRSGSDQV
jgi:hypothetical protein